MSASPKGTALAHRTAVPELAETVEDADLPVEVLERMLRVEKARRRAREELLRGLPRWRFRRRRAVEGRISRRRARETGLREALHAASPGRE